MARGDAPDRRPDPAGGPSPATQTLNAAYRPEVDREFSDIGSDFQNIFSGLSAGLIPSAPIRSLGTDPISPTALPTDAAIGRGFNGNVLNTDANTIQELYNDANTINEALATIGADNNIVNDIINNIPSWLLPMSSIVPVPSFGSVYGAGNNIRNLVDNAIRYGEGIGNVVDQVRAAAPNTDVSSARIDLQPTIKSQTYGAEPNKMTQDMSNIDSNINEMYNRLPYSLRFISDVGEPDVYGGQVDDDVITEADRLLTTEGPPGSVDPIVRPYLTGGDDAREEVISRLNKEPLLKILLERIRQGDLFSGGTL
mgnify:CR=1 FL=1